MAPFKRRVACFIPAPGIEKVEPLAEACLRFSPVIAVREGEAIFFDITGCAQLYSERSLELRARLLGGRFGTDQSARFAVADHAGAALALARHGGGDLGALPLEAMPLIASPFRRDEDQEKRFAAHLSALKALGLKTVGDLLALPSASLASRFGKEMVRAAAQARGEMEPAWPAFRPEPRVVDRAAVDELATQTTAADLEALLLLLRGLADRALARLCGRGQRASAVRVEFELEHWSTLKGQFTREWKIELPLPQGTVRGLIPILRERLSQDLARQPLRAPVAAVALEILESVPGTGAQRHFFSREEEESEMWNALVGRLSEKLGRKQVFVARPVERWLPEGAYVRALAERAPVAAGEGCWPALPVRPTRLLPRPELLRREGRVLIHSQRGMRWRIARWDGPERLSGEWWEPAGGFARDYFQVTSETGEKLWVFADSTRLWLHGYFD